MILFPLATVCYYFIGAIFLSNTSSYAWNWVIWAFQLSITFGFVIGIWISSVFLYSLISVCLFVNMYKVTSGCV